mmetsp:Transcript_46327/g.74286  ORF Transcript_46327/g.74286 Transcript_46327/m.74286 type:complete len:231 (-) Transcript_46327:279-971(-)
MCVTLMTASRAVPGNLPPIITALMDLQAAKISQMNARPAVTLTVSRKINLAALWRLPLSMTVYALKETVPLSIPRPLHPERLRNRLPQIQPPHRQAIRRRHPANRHLVRRRNNLRNLHLEHRRKHRRNHRQQIPANLHLAHHRNNLRNLHLDRRPNRRLRRLRHNQRDRRCCRDRHTLLRLSQRIIRLAHRVNHRLLHRVNRRLVHLLCHRASRRREDRVKRPRRVQKQV